MEWLKQRNLEMGTRSNRICVGADGLPDWTRGAYEIGLLNGEKAVRHASGTTKILPELFQQAPEAFVKKNWSDLKAVVVDKTDHL